MRGALSTTALAIVLGTLALGAQPEGAPTTVHAAAMPPALPANVPGEPSTAFSEMLFGPRERMLRWQAAPQLVVLMSVMRYGRDVDREHLATADTMSDAEASALAADLTAALRSLTNGTFVQFSALKKEWVPPGTATPILRPGFIVAGRYAGLREALQTIGLGGRASRADGTITSGSILLDNTFDRDSTLKRLLRTHELGHALGYNHVTSRLSIMNPRIGSELTDFDRQAIRLAFSASAQPVH